MMGARFVVLFNNCETSIEKICDNQFLKHNCAKIKTKTRMGKYINT